jgi:arylsulfatase A-like enzyme
MGDIKNILIFVSDSLRWDLLPPDIREKGVTFKTVAQSTYSPPSFTTLSTGLYPPQHGVRWFNSHLADDVRTTYDIGSMDTMYYNKAGYTSDPLYQIYGITEPGTLAELKPPFWYLERDTTPHAPYVQHSRVKGTHIKSYMNEISNLDEAKEDYRKTIHHSFSLLQSRMDILERLGSLEDTLVLLTADHGELFGEYGEIFHVTPTCPELVYVPTVFIHPTLSEDSFEVNPETEIIEHVDVIETCLNAVGRGDELPTVGTDILSEARPRDFGYNHVDVQRRGISAYQSKSLWWSDGGYVDIQNNKINRSLFILYRLFKAPYGRKYLRRNWQSIVKEYNKDEKTYGTLPISREEAVDILEKFSNQFGEITENEFEMDEHTKDHLENLGYIVD